MKMWAGRFKKEADKRLDDFNSSIYEDVRLYEHDIIGSMAHATMLAASGIIEKSEGDLIVKTLEEILNEIKSGELEIDMNSEDIHMFVEEELTKRIDKAGKRLHTARSRNDQVALDTRMYVRDELKKIISLTKELMKVLCDKASENLNTVMPGYTHLQRAQPITFAHHLMAYTEMFYRDVERMESIYLRMNVLPLGSGALAGTTYPLNREMVKNALDFTSVSRNSMDGVSDRDYCIEAISAMAIIMMHLSRFCEEIIMWCSWEFKFIELDDAFSTGSSIMPQKKNPDIAELIRGKTGRVYGDLMNILTMMKGIPLAYNKDMQECKQPVFDALDTVSLCIETFIPMLDTVKVLKENMRNAAARGFINATDCADYLVKKGLPFREAYKITGELVAICIDRGETLESLPLSEYLKQSEIFDEEIYTAINLEKCVNDRTIIGSPAPQTVEKHIKEICEYLKD